MNPQLNAIVVTDFEVARARAVEADRALSAGKLWGPLPGVFSGEHTIDADMVVAGPMARSAHDLKLALGLMTALHAVQRRAWRLEMPPTRGLKLDDFRVGAWLEHDAFPVDAGVLDCLQSAVDLLADNGVNVVDAKPDIDFVQSHETFQMLLRSALSIGMPAAQIEGVNRDARLLSADDHSDRACNVRSLTLSHRDWLMLGFVRNKLRQAWADFFAQFDVLLCPTVGVSAFAHDHLEDRFNRKLAVNGEMRSYVDTTTAWTGLVGVVYLPATIAPVGRSKDGLPVGVQIVAPYLEDYTAIHFAELIEEIVGGYTPPPGFD